METISLAFKYVFIEFFGGIVRWPLWWYTEGLVLVLKGTAGSLDRYYQSVALGVWIKNLFVPMYGLRDWQGRLISFFMRLVQIFFRGFALVIWAMLLLVGVVVYVALPILTVFQILFHLGGSLL